jgi:hypothetical protein
MTASTAHLTCRIWRGPEVVRGADGGAQILLF